jgi:hypothetical protein
LWRYSRRELNNVLSVSGDEQFRSIILMVHTHIPGSEGVGGSFGPKLPLHMAQWLWR